MAPIPQQQDFMVFPKSTKTTWPMCPIVWLVAQQHTTLPNSSLKFFKITLARLHPLLKIVEISSGKLNTHNKSSRRDLSLISHQCSIHHNTSTCCIASYPFQNFYLHQFHQCLQDPYRNIHQSS